MKHDTTMEDLIESLSLALTHNRVGVYAQNAQFVRERVYKIIALARTSAQSTCDERIKQAVREREELFQKINLKELVNEMKNSIQEHGDMHGEFCHCNMEDPDACECEEMAFWGKIIQEWMGKVNEMWVVNLKNHRKHCTKDGRKDLTKINSVLLAPEKYTCPSCGDPNTARDGHYDCSAPETLPTNTK